MKRVLVLDALQRSALAVTRSLGRRGITIITADETPSALAGYSRYSDQYVTYPSPVTHPDNFIVSITHLIKDLNIDVVFPMTELTTTLMHQCQQDLPGVMLPFPDMVVIDSLSDKCNLMRVAESLGIPVPRTWHAEGLSALPCDLTDLHYPIVLKPGKSWLRNNGKWLHSSVRFAANAHEAQTYLNTDPAFSLYPFMLQECIKGTGQGVFAIYDHGQAVAFFAHRRLREKPPRGGVSVLSESIPVDPVYHAHACALLDHANWHGIAMVEFKVADDGTPYLMEINTRFWGSLQLAIDAGVDFPWLLYQVATGTRPETVTDYKTGIRLRWLLGDLDNLYLTLRDRQYTLKEKLEAMLHFLTPAPFRTRHETNRWADMGPFRYELKHYLRDLFN